MRDLIAKAGVLPVRQRTQYSCMAASMAMCLAALGHKCNEDEVNQVMGATPMKGAAWEQALATSQHYGCRATLTCPSTVEQLKAWTDAGIPVMIAWNPEGREWSHASVVFDVDDDGNVYVADPNIPDPSETVRIVPKAEFYKKWYEKWPKYLVRRPALAVEREITSDGRQVMASKTRTASWTMDPGKDPWKEASGFDGLIFNAGHGIYEWSRESGWASYESMERHNSAKNLARKPIFDFDVVRDLAKKHSNRVNSKSKRASAERVAALYLARQ